MQGIDTFEGFRAGEDASPLLDTLRVLWRRKWLILLCAVGVPLVAVLLALRHHRVYEASAQVFLNRQNDAAQLAGVPDYSSYVSPADYAQTQIILANSPAVQDGLVRRLGGGPGVDLGTTGVQASGGSDLLFFQDRNSDATRAANVANAYAHAFVAYRRRLDTGAVTKARDELLRQVNDLQARHRQHTQLYQDTIAKAQQLSTLSALQNSVLFFRPATGAAQVEPRPVRNGVIGLGLGLLLGLGLAFLWHTLDTRVRSADELGERLGLPLLGRIPEPPRKLRRSNTFSMLADPGSVHAEAFRVLKTNLEFVNLERRARTIMFTSAVESEGKSTTVVNVAVAFARAGGKVALVDLDLRRPHLDRFFSLNGHPGVTDVALGRVQLETALTQAAIAPDPPVTRRRGSPNGGAARDFGGSLEVLASGPIPPNPGEFVASRVLEEILDAIEARVDLVLIDAPPLLHVGDALALSAKVDALVVVSKLSTARRPIVRELRRVLDTAPASKLGFVLTGVAADEAYRYGGHYAVSGAGRKTHEPVA